MLTEREVIPLEREMLFGSAPNHAVDYGGLGVAMVGHGLLAEAVGGQSPQHHPLQTGRDSPIDIGARGVPLTRSTGVNIADCGSGAQEPACILTAHSS